MKNIINYTIVILLILSGSYLTGCNGPDIDAESYSYEYRMDVEEFSKLRMFSYSNVIEDQAFIRDFIERRFDEGILKFFDSPPFHYNYSTDSIHAHISFAKRINKFEVIANDNVVRKMTKKNGITYWERQDTTVVSCAFNPFCALEPLYLEKSLSYPFDWSVFGRWAARDTKFKDCIYLVENPQETYLPMSAFFLSRSRSNVYQRCNNMVLKDEEIISMLNKEDTLVVQESRLFLKKAPVGYDTDSKVFKSGSLQNHPIENIVIEWDQQGRVILYPDGSVKTIK